MKQWSLLGNGNASRKKHNIQTPWTSLAKSESEAENYGKARHKITQRVTIHSTQIEAVPASNNRQEQEVEMHAAWARKVESSEDGEVYNSQRVAQVPHKLVAGGGAYLVTFKELVDSKEVVVSSMPHVKLHPAVVDLSGVFSPETSGKEMESEAETPIRH